MKRALTNYFLSEHRRCKLKNNIKNNKGQITLFIIIGLIVLLVVSFSIYFLYYAKQAPSIPQQKIIKVDKTSVELHISQCLETVLRDGVYLIASQGGYVSVVSNPKYKEKGFGYDSPKMYYYLGDSILPHLINKDEINMRSIEQIQDSLSNYVSEEIKSCVNVKQYEDIGYSVKAPKEISAETIILLDDVKSVVSFPLTLEKQGSIIQIQKVSSRINLRFGRIYEKVNLFAKNSAQNAVQQQPYDFSNDCALYSMDDGLLNVYFVDNADAYNYAVRFVDAKPLITENQKPLTFSFAVKNNDLSGECKG